MGGRGGAGSLSYQGNNGGSGRARSSGVNVSQMKSVLPTLAANVTGSKLATEAISQIENLSGKNAKVTIYRATPGDKINSGDWIFLSKAQAERWTKTPMGRTKPGFKVLERTVKASNVDWTGKNLEFVYTGKRKL
ncbi:MAG: hypothetical protein LUG47_05385 [Clostridiales bacterium]|nr:hypothetical protein [Clostridiales bacterium]